MGMDSSRRLPAVSRRTPKSTNLRASTSSPASSNSQYRRNITSATATLSAAVRLLKSTSAMRGTCGGMCAANCSMASGVSPKKAAMSAWAVVPPPTPSHHAPCASVEMKGRTCWPKSWL